MEKFTDKINKKIRLITEGVSQDEVISHLKYLIQEYDDENDRLELMIRCWIEDGDPMSDPGLQYEQENKVESIYKKIIEYIKSL